MMSSNLAEIPSEPRLHEVLDLRLQPLPRRTQDGVDDGRYVGGLRAPRLIALKRSFLSTLLAFPATGMLATRALSLQNAASEGWIALRTQACDFLPIHFPIPPYTAP